MDRYTFLKRFRKSSDLIQYDMLGFVKKLFDYNQREVDRIKKIVDSINALEDDARKLKDGDFAKETEGLKKQVQSNEKTLDEVLPWAYAMVREASRRVSGLRHFDEQLIAAISLHEGKIAEQKTGEGKTLSATAPLYLNALAGRGAHLVTVNDYLARRDAGWMGQIYHLLGVSVSSMISDKSYLYDPEYEDNEVTDWRLIHLKEISRQEAYAADITYGINSEFGFDYLRDNMAKSPENLVQRNFSFAIIDEVDSVLIDEARTPHIISAAYEQDVSKYYDYAKIVERLDDTDYTIDEKLRTAHLNDKGITKIEKILGIDNVYEQDYNALFHIEAALKARTLFKIDKDYIVKDGEVIIVDEFTGRLLQGRRFSEGLHQAIEAKETVEIKRESKTLATVSLQNYFRMYKKLAGMTGTAQTEAEEFNKIYKLEVIVVPTHRNVVRQDHSDLIYKTERGKYTAVVEEIARLHHEGRPVLVGTTSIDKNETLSRLLKKKGVTHELLNAKNHEREAQIISRAGEKSAVTVATNMAGRGVDIVLGGEPPSRYERKDKKGKAMDEKKFNKLQEDWQKKHDEVVKLGGLTVIATERHESRRIDNQLRGRSGRQGDPGDTRFFVSLEDDLMRIFGGDQVAKMMDFFKLPEDQPLEHGMVSKALEQAQIKVEGFNFDTRKNLVEFDDVLNKQREILYTTRQTILKSSQGSPEKLEEEVRRAFNEDFMSLLNTFIYLQQEPDYEGLQRELELIFPDKVDRLIKKAQMTTSPDEAGEILMTEFEGLYKARKKDVGEAMWFDVIRYIFLDTIDKLWTEHLTGIDDLRQGINLRGYAQLDPLTEYKNEAFSMFEKLLADINFDFIRRIFKVRIDVQPEQMEEKEIAEQKQMKLSAASAIDPFAESQKVVPAPAPQQQEQPVIMKPAGAPDQAAPQEVGGFKITPPGTTSKKPGRNDPCWCGSGKKYKKCHLISDLD